MASDVRAAGVLLAAVLAGACQPAAVPTPGDPGASGSVAPPTEAPLPSTATITGSIFVDFHDERSCDEQPAPRELAGVGLTFTDADGTVVRETATGPVERQPIADGCRFFAGYAVELPGSVSYRVDFEPSVPPPARGGYFDGVNQLEPQTITMVELAARGFIWHFEVLPAFVA
jgi:hypothetical protein